MNKAALRRLNPQRIELRDRSIGRGEANPNFDLFIGVVGAVLANLDAVGYELHHITDIENI